MSTTQTLGLCMIVKNEATYLSQCLESVKDIVKEIIIVDTGSTDQTTDIALKYKAQLYHYKWDNNFSHARNFSISKSTCDWILLLDADETLAPNDKENLINLIQNTDFDGFYFTIYNYTGLCPSPNIMTHQAFRLLRNNGNYMYMGAIHEQIIRIKDSQPALFVNSNITLYHYGYLNAAISDKDKRNRNIPLIKKQLETEPQNPFYLYNLGNEYIAESYFTEALTTYKLSLQYALPTQNFTANLYYRTITCLFALKNYDEALSLCDTALEFYPDFTDIIFQKAIIYTAQNKLTLAIATYNDCITLGEAPKNLCFIHGSGTFLPLLALADLYFQYKDYQNALNYYTKALSVDNTLYYILYRIGKTLLKLTHNPTETLSLLSKYFSDLTSSSNLALWIDILLSLNLYEQVNPYLDQLTLLAPSSYDINYLKGKYYFYTYDYMNAELNLEKILPTSSPSLFAASTHDTLQYLFLINLILKKVDKALSLLHSIQENDSLPKDTKLTYFLLYKGAFFPLELDSYISCHKTDLPTDLAFLKSCITLLLKVKELSLLEVCKSLLKQLAPDDYWLQLAEIYFELDYLSEAKNYVYEAIRAFCPLTHNALTVLSHTLDQ